MSWRITGMTDRGKVWEFPDDTTRVETGDRIVIDIEPATAITIELDIPPGVEIGGTTTYYGGPA
jgi:hypothetical protein